MFHPLYGREFALVELRSVWGEQRVYFHDDHGTMRRMPATWTTAASPDPFVEVSAGRSHFCTDDLLRLAELIAHLRDAMPSKRRPRQKKPL